MKKIIPFLMFIAVFSSCSTDDDEPDEKAIIEEVTIKTSETFNYDLGYFGIEEGAFIQKHPENSAFSEIIQGEVPGDLFYRYKAKENFRGEDYVEIWTGRGSDGGSPNTEIAVVKITLNVVE